MKFDISKTVFIVCITLIANICSACSCLNMPRTFIKNIKSNQVIFAAEVVEHVDLPNTEHKYYAYHSLTKLVVFKWYQNRMKLDTIYYVNGEGGFCLESIRGYKPGEKLIIKSENSFFQIDAIYGQSSNEHVSSFVKKYSGKPFIGNEICDISILKYLKNRVVGNISINYQDKRWKCVKITRKFSKKWAENLQNKMINGSQKFQKMSYNRFNKLMARKCTTYNNAHHNYTP